MIPFFYAAIAVSIAGLLGATYTDLKARIVPNWMNYGLTAVGLLIGLGETIIEANPLPFFYSILGLCIGFTFAWLLWKGGVFAGGDVKLFMALGALNPFTPALLKSGIFTSISLPLFPITLFICSLIAFIPYGLFVIIHKLSKNKKVRKEIFTEMKPKIVAAFFGAIMASAVYVILIFSKIDPLWTLPLLFIWGLLRKKGNYLAVVLLVVAAILNTNLLAQALIAAIIISVGFYTLIKLLFSSRRLLVSEMKVIDLEEGIIPAKSLIKKDGKIVEAEGIDFAKILNYAKSGKFDAVKMLFAPKNEIISARKACGLTVEEAKLLKKLSAKGAIPKTILVKESMPFVPTMLLGYIICLIVGDFALIIMGLV